ncbi:MAG: methyltransferase domain-containing protein [Actinobacteria bacterium]|nr:methyltransferase domain-containing protein [Actinomycetota bacterium]
MDLKSQHSKKVWEDFWQEKQQIEEVYSNSDRIIKQIQQTVDVKGMLIMEVGAGSGRDSFKLIDAGAQVITLDYAESSLGVIKKLAQKYGVSIFLIRGDAFHLPFKDNVLDVVFHQGLLEHFENPQDILAENYRVIKPGGITLADVPQRYHPYTVVKHVLIWMNKWFAGWETEFSKGQLEKMFLGCGFHLQRIYGEWMRPSFFYRAFREALKKVGVHLPLYPKGIPGLSKLRHRCGKYFKKTGIAYYTFMDIGVIGLKKKHEKM